MNEFIQFLGQAWDWLQKASSYVGSGVAIVGVFVAAIKPLRERLIHWVQKQAKTKDQEEEISQLRDSITALGQQMTAFQDEMRKGLSEERERQKEHNRSVDEALEDLKHGNFYTLGNVIREVYHNNKDDKTVSEHEYDLCKKVWDLYGVKWHQNGPVEAMWAEIQTWEKIFS
jgi:hypothetical protein